MIVSIQGAPGSFSEGAAREFVGAGAELLNSGSFDGLFAAVASGRADRGVVPVRNTIAGLIADNAARVGSPEFVELGRLSFPVAQCLIARERVPVKSLRRVASHPAALQQCLKFFATVPGCERVPVSDTGGGVRDLMAGVLDVDAVIGSAGAARLYGGTIILDRVDDVEDNSTEFVLFALASRFAQRR